MSAARALVEDGELGNAVILSDGTTGASNTLDLARPAVGLFLLAATDVKITFFGGKKTTVTLSGLPTGVLIPFHFSRLWNTGTPANVLVAYSEI